MNLDSQLSDLRDRIIRRAPKGQGDDLFQEVWVSCLAYNRSTDWSIDQAKLVLCIAKRKGADLWNALRRHPHTDQGLDQVLTREPCPQLLAELREREEVLRLVAREVPHGSLVVGLHLDDRTLNDVAVAEHVALETTRTRYKRARNRLSRDPRVQALMPAGRAAGVWSEKQPTTRSRSREKLPAEND